MDWDGDGDLDLWVNYRSGPQVRFMRNEIGSRNHFIAIGLTGVQCNRDAIGARVEVRTSDRTVIKTLRASVNYTVQGSKWLHFGLGDSSEVERVTVRWPDGSTASYSNVSADARYQITQGADKPKRLGVVASGDALQPSNLEAIAHTGVASVWLGSRLPMPDLTLDYFDGSQQRLSDLKGKPVLINLWASWCAPCAAELRSFVQSQRAWQDSGVTLIALSVDKPQDRSKALDAAQRLGFWFPAGMSSGEFLQLLEVIKPSILDRFEELPLPTSLLLDEQGRLAKIYLGPCETAQVVQDAKQLASGDREILLQSSERSGEWRFPEAIATNQRGRRLLNMTMQLTDREYPGLAATYAAQLVGFVDEVNPLPVMANKSHAAVLAVANGLQPTAPGRALQFYRWLQGLTPDNPMVLLGLTDALLALKDPATYGEAAEAFRRALSVLPEASTSTEFATRGNTYFRLGRWGQAAIYLREAVAIDPDNATTRANLGLALLKSGEDEEGVQYLEDAIAELETNPTNELALGQALDRIGETERAAVHLQRFAELAPTPQTAMDHAAYGNVLVRLGRFSEAIGHLETAILAQPDNAGLKWLLGTAHIQGGDPNTAVELLEAGIASRPQNAGDEYLCGIALARSGQMDRAEPHFRRALEIDPDHQLALRGLGLALDSLRKWDEAIDLYQAFLQQVPNDARIWDKVSLALDRQGREAEAEAAYRTVLQLTPDRDAAKLRLGWILATSREDGRRNGAEALTLAQQVATKNGRGSPLTLEVLAAAYAETGQFQLAVQAAEEARKLLGNDQPQLLKAIDERLNLYRQGKPYHGDP